MINYYQDGSIDEHFQLQFYKEAQGYYQFRGQS